MATPIPRILLAVEAKVDYLQKTTPGAGGKSAPAPPSGRKSRRWPPSPEHRAKVASDVAAAFGAVGANKKRR